MTLPSAIQLKEISSQALELSKESQKLLEYIHNEIIKTLINSGTTAVIKLHVNISVWEKLKEYLERQNIKYTSAFLRNIDSVWGGITIELNQKNAYIQSTQNLANTHNQNFKNFSEQLQEKAKSGCNSIKIDLNSMYLHLPSLEPILKSLGYKVKTQDSIGRYLIVFWG